MRIDVGWLKSLSADDIRYYDKLRKSIQASVSQHIREGKSKKVKVGRK